MRTGIPLFIGNSKLLMIMVCAVYGITAQAQKPVANYSPNAAAVCKKNGVIEVFALGQNQAVWHNWQDRPNGKFKPSWSSLGLSNCYQIVATTNAAGLSHVFVITTNREVYTANLQTNTWTPWSRLAKGIGLIATANFPDGRILVLGVTTNKCLMRCWQTAPNGKFGKWASMGGPNVHSVVIGKNADGRLQGFAVALEGVVYSVTQTSGGGWEWSEMGGAMMVTNTLLAVAKNQKNCLELFGFGADNVLWHARQVEPNGAEWTGFEKLGGSNLKRKMAVGQDVSGCLQLFALDTAGTVWASCQDSRGRWKQAQKFGGSGYRSLSIARNADGRLQLFSRGNDGGIWTCQQTPPDRKWSAWSRMGTTTFR